MRREAMNIPPSPMASRYATFTSWNAVTVPVVSERTSSIPWYSGRQRTTHWSSLRVDGDRVEGRGEEEHRQHDELDEVEVLPAPHPGHGGDPGSCEPEPDHEARGKRQECPPRLDEAEQR